MRQAAILLALSGMGCSIDGGITKYNTDPTVTFTAPTNGSIVVAGAPIVLSANVYDGQQDTSELDFNWGIAPTGTIDPSAQLIAGRTVSLELRDGLSVGTWVVNLQVFDADGAVAEDEVTFTAVEYIAPTVTFIRPVEGGQYAAGQPLDVDVQFNDPDQNDISRLSLTWGGIATGEPAAPLHPDSDGHARFTLPAQAVGTESLSVQVVDDDGGSGTGSITLDILNGDLDGDGYIDVAFAGDDCDDSHPEIHPGAIEHCDGIDEDCDGSIDEDPPIWYGDGDGDGYGDPNVFIASCTQEVGYVSDNTDCQDGDATVHPLADEHCDGLDENCDGDIDENPVDGTPSWQDGDGDSYGDPNRSTLACEVPVGSILNDSDCDDYDATIHPLSDERCNGYDDNCDGLIDDSLAIDQTTWYADDDGDGYGDALSPWLSCTAPNGYVVSSNDCNDGNILVYPGALEYCNGYDDDCDGQSDENSAIDATVWYTDNDVDGFGDGNTATPSCTAPTDTVSIGTDCDDSNPFIYPGSIELCNGDDDDCDGSVDEADAQDADVWYADRDQDSYGDATQTRIACTNPVGYISNSTDCNDLLASVNPGASEQCDSIDNDCDAVIDEDDAIDAGTWYADNDGDSYGGGTGRRACSQPAGTLANGADCDDALANINPGATEICNSLDDDCDATTDDADPSLDLTTATLWYADNDGDTYGDIAQLQRSCLQPTDAVSDATDCDDSLASVNPGETEICNDGLDNNCDGSAAGCTWSGELNLRNADVQTIGTTAGDALSVTAFGQDVDGDGIQTIALGATASDLGGSNSGTVYLFSDPSDGRLGASSASVQITGSAGEGLGSVMVSMGDVSGDGVEDWMIGNPNSTSVSNSAGVAHLLLGPVSSGTLASQTDWSVSGVAYDLLGSSAVAGDMNDDGVQDVIVGAPVSGSHNSHVYAFSGPFSSGTATTASAYLTLTSTTTTWDLGTTLAVRDLDGDGSDDLAVGGPTSYTNSGSVELFAGPLTGSRTTSQANGILLGASTALAGTSIVPAGDVNSDGYEDLLISSPRHSFTHGAIWVISGGTSLPNGYLSNVCTTAFIPSTASYWGTIGVGSFDEDGTTDLAIGDSLYSSSTGAVMIFFDIATLSGTITEASRDARWLGQYTGDAAGAFLAGGDADGDGQDDLLVGSAGEDSGGTGSGSVYLLRGPAL